jgi:hypothetical protein
MTNPPGPRGQCVKSSFLGLLLLTVGGFELWRFSMAWGEPLGLLYAMPLFLLGAWSITDAANSPPVKAHPTRDDGRTTGLEAWFVISCAVAAVAALALAALVASALHWAWVSGRIGGVLAPLGVTSAAAIASAGAARTLMAQNAIATRSRFEDAERLLWQRFDKATEQLSHDHYAVRAAGVYSLAGLADDWIRHNESLKNINVGVPQRRSVSDECETIIEILSAYLRSNRHTNPKLDRARQAEEVIVNEAIITAIAAHTELSGNAADDPRPERIGLWAGRKIVIDLRYADLRDVLWKQVDLEGAVLFGAILYNADLTGANLLNANLCGADLRRTCLEEALLDGANLDEIEYDPEHTHWPKAPFALPSSVRKNTAELPPISQLIAPKKWWRRWFNWFTSEIQRRKLSRAMANLH